MPLNLEKVRDNPLTGYRRLLLAGGAVVAILLAVAAAAPLIAPYEPNAIFLESSFTSPGKGHWFGGDRLGRDVFSRVVYGTRISVMVGILVVGISFFTGTVIGSISGFFGGILDEIIMRIVDILLAFPGILLAIALTAVLGPSLKNIIFALSLLGWVGYARIVRGQFLSVREREFVEAARSQGIGDFRIIFKHILPHTIAPILVEASFGMGGVILAESSLSFLGLGSPEWSSWGSILSEGAEFMRVAPHIAVFPGMAIMISVLGFNILGDGVQGWLMKKSRPFTGK